MFQSLSFKNRAFETTWLVFLILYCISVFVSKSGISIFGSLLILMSLFVLDWKEVAKSRKELLVFVALYPLAIFLGLFSMGHAFAAKKVATSWPWVLLALPALVVFSRKRDQRVAVISGCFGLAVACVTALTKFFVDYDGVFTSKIRIAAFWDVLRWGSFLSISVIGLLSLLIYFSDKNSKRSTMAILSLFLISSVCLGLANARAAWVATSIGCLVLLVLYPRVIKFVSIFGAIAVILVSANQGIRERVYSIVSIEKSEDGKVTSKDKSNEGRLHMWQVGVEFFWLQPWFGTGFENSEKPLRDFMASKPGYVEKYVTSEFSYRDQHSSYLTSFVQFGALFSLSFWMIIAYFVFCHLRDWWHDRNLWSGSIVAISIAHLIMFVFYSSVLSYEMTLFFPFLPLLIKGLDSTKNVKMEIIRAT